MNTSQWYSMLAKNADKDGVPYDPKPETKRKRKSKKSDPIDKELIRMSVYTE